MSNAQKKIECIYCHYHFPDRQETWDKVRMNNGKLRCKECGNTFEVNMESPSIRGKEDTSSQTTPVKENVEPVVQENNTKDIICPNCGHTYSARPDMWEKIKSVNGKLRCAKCKTTFQVPLDKEVQFEDLDYGFPFADGNKPSEHLSSTSQKRQCPFCSEIITASASKCRHCGEWVGPVEHAILDQNPKNNSSYKNSAGNTEEEQLIWQGSPSQIGNIGEFILCVLFFWLVFPILLMIWQWLYTKSIMIKITNQRVVIEHGVFSKSTEILELYRVNDILLRQPFFYRLYGLGKIGLVSSDRSSKVLWLDAIPNTSELAELIRKKVEIRRVQKKVLIHDMAMSLDV